MTHRPLRLSLSTAALQQNWRWLADRAGVPAAAAIKSDGYGLGAAGVAERLFEVGARDFFVSTWDEAEALGPLPEGSRLAVLHGLGPDDAPAASQGAARPVLNSVQQVQRWRAAFGDRPCDVMVDTGMNRLGLSMDELDALDGLQIDMLHSHLACADEDHRMNAAQLARFSEAKQKVKARRYSLANSAGICLGRDYSFDMVRPGLALYGGIPRAEAKGQIRAVVTPEAQVLQVRTLKAGETVGYGATFTAERDTPVAILNIGYADGYWRNLTGRGHARMGDTLLPLIGRVSMDLVAVDISRGGDWREGDWMALDFDLPKIAADAGVSQYEMLTGLGSRYERRWD
ncbi:alanine racemase [Sphingomicrobium lutaoense]|uniref:Alanine racemase n=1 Tax=Sphingomicrobium lutaoense TaxID=515949 RepID=A0A839Z1W4_9SPHN|nr:alanine racemase [Sphingomicrobium lutaoense]MBB3764037.1 alanine racemase [Sphingomicrobium lutaoense]